LRHRWLQNRFCAEVLRMWHFRRVLNGPFVDQVLAGRRPTAESDHRLSLATLLETFGQAAPVRISQLVRLGTDPIGGTFSPTLPSDAVAAEELLRAYDKLRVTHQDCFFY